ncbi:MAG TPA: NAD(P)-dependent oxidoreductase [Actinomycetota bacterium]|nr:NAD(P)-dependent oxidoreductase [Actinomycetota bacterium]
MSTLVTGACGFIGSHLVEVLAEAGHEVVATDLPSALDAPQEDRTRWPEVCSAAGAKLVPLDLTDRDSIEAAVSGAELVFHVAAVFDYLAPVELLRAVNVEGSRNLFNVLAARGECRRVVNWGAGGVYGPPVAAEGPFTEESPKRPSNPYLVSKWDQEVLAHTFRERGLEVTSVRTTSPYGPRAVYGSGQLLVGLAERPVAFRNLTGNIPFVHVRDLCRAAVHLVGHASADGEAYNVTDDGRIDAVQLARLVADELGTKAKILPALPIGVLRKTLSGVSKVSMAVARRSGKRPLLEYDQVQYFGRDFIYSNSKLKQTGFEFEMPQPEEGLRSTLRWYVDNGWIDSKYVRRG